MRHLRLVRPPGQQGTDPPKRRYSSRTGLSLSNQEIQHLRVAIKNAARAYGGFDVLASVTGLSADTLRHAASCKRHRAGAALALAIARASGLTMEGVLTGQLTMAGRCKACGSSLGQRAAAGGAS
jgi:hypothetical protein